MQNKVVESNLTGRTGVNSGRNSDSLGLQLASKGRYSHSKSLQSLLPALLASMLLCSCSGSYQAPPVASKVVEGSDEIFDQQVKDFKGPVLVDFYADWCIPCKQMAPIIDDLSTATEFTDKVRFMRINIDKCPRTAHRFNVKELPEVVIFTNGKVLDGSVGVAPQVKLEDRLYRALKLMG